MATNPLVERVLHMLSCVFILFLRPLVQGIGRIIHKNIVAEFLHMLIRNVEKNVAIAAINAFLLLGEGNRLLRRYLSAVTVI